MLHLIMHNIHKHHTDEIKKMRIWIIKTLTDNIKGVKVNGHPHSTMYNTISLCLPVDSRKLVSLLDKKKIFVNTGSACSKGQTSKVLDAIGIDPEMQKGSIRISLGFLNTWQHCYIATSYIISYTKLLLWKSLNSK
ncbi:aminotransferase class V-fold PLP-dependent enzyme [bacterium]|nr:aminotransferase class V-fold PLP-dependent enzyme [Candidatus Elulimicrobium humile]